jgi:hypothetical protein
MAKSAMKLPNITEEKQPWGIRLLLTPFPGDPKFALMEISAQVEKPTENRKLPCIKIRFNAVPLAHQFEPTQVIVWTEALKQLTERAKELAANFKTKPNKKKKPGKPG